MLLIDYVIDYGGTMTVQKDERVATIKDVAKLSGVSTATVSHILNNTRPVSDELRSRVRTAIDELNYRPYGLARNLRRRASRTVGVLVPDNTNPFFAEMARLLEDRFFAAGYSVIICNTEQNPQKELAYLDLLAEKAVDGLVFVSTGNDADAIEKISSSDLPCVLIDRDIEVAGINRVISDNSAGAILATDHLIKLGHQHIACITGPAGLASTEERLAGYRQAIAAAGLQETVAAGDFQIESGGEALRQLLSRDTPPTAVFAFNDLMALAAMHAAVDCGVAIPGDLSVVGFDDIDIAAFAIPPLTTVQQPREEIAAETVRLLFAAGMNDGQGSSAVDRDEGASRHVVTPRLIVRRSTAPPTLQPGGSS